MVGIQRPKPDAGSIIEPKPASLWLLLRHLQPLAAPDALNPILANLNAACVQQGRHPAIAVTAILRGKEDDIPRQLIFIGLERGNIALCSRGCPTIRQASRSVKSVELVPSYSRLAFVGLRLRSGEGPAVDF